MLPSSNLTWINKESILLSKWILDVFLRNRGNQHFHINIIQCCMMHCILFLILCTIFHIFLVAFLTYSLKLGKKPSAWLNILKSGHSRRIWTLMGDICMYVAFIYFFFLCCCCIWLKKQFNLFILFQTSEWVFSALYV